MLLTTDFLMPKPVTLLGDLNTVLGENHEDSIVKNKIKCSMRSDLLNHMTSNEDAG